MKPTRPSGLYLGTGAGLVLALVALGGCAGRELPVAALSGVILDAASGAPLVGVKVQSKQASTASDDSGHYKLTVTQGVREITYAAPDRPPVRKFVVAKSAEAIQLDVLYPATGPAARRALVLARGLALAEDGGALVREAGEENLVSVTDDLGNEETFLALGHGGYPVYSPVWDPAADAIYYGVQSVLSTKDKLDQLGVFRFDLAGGRKRVWGPDTALGPESIAVAPDGKSLAASLQQSVLVVRDLAGSPRAEVLREGPSQVTAIWGFADPVAWAPGPDILLPAYDKAAAAGRSCARRPGRPRSSRG
jgi:hypothetical protein